VLFAFFPAKVKIIDLHTSGSLKSSWKSPQWLSKFRWYSILNDSRWDKALSKTCFFSAGSRPDIRSRNTWRAITIYFSSALLFGIHIMLKTSWIPQSVQSLGYFMPEWSILPFQSCNSVPGFALVSKSPLTSHLNVLFFLWLTRYKCPHYFVTATPSHTTPVHLNFWHTAIYKINFITVTQHTQFPNK